MEEDGHLALLLSSLISTFLRAREGSRRSVCTPRALEGLAGASLRRKRALREAGRLGRQGGNAEGRRSLG